MSNVINASGKTLVNSRTGAVYAPSTRSYSASSNSASPLSVISSYGNNNNVGSAVQVAFKQPGLGSVVGNKDAERSGDIRNYNNMLSQYLTDLAWSRNLSSARETSDYNYNMMKEANAFNMQVMKNQQDFQQYMSNTAHQREVADLVAAGLNPVISANQGASTPSGSAVSSAMAHGESANSPVANVDMNQYASNSLMSVLTDVFANWLVKHNGSNIVKDTANNIKDGALKVINSVFKSKTKMSVKGGSNVRNYATGGGSR